MSDGLKLLSAVVQHGSVEMLRKLDESLFIGSEIRVYQFIRQHYRRYAQLPACETITQELRVRMPDPVEVAAFYEKKVRDRKLYGILSNEFPKFRDSLKANNMDGARNQISVMRGLVREASVDEDIRDLRQAVRGAMRKYEYSKANPGLSGIPTGWNWLDEETGGWQAGDLISLVARMGMGKTNLLLKSALSAWEAGYSVLVVSMEMTITQIVERVMGMQAGINPKYLKKGALSTRAERRLRRVLDHLVGTERFHIYAGGFNKHVDELDLLLQEYDPDCAYIDGAYVLKPEGRKSMSRVERMAEVMDSIKKMTITHNRPIVQTTQLNRTAGKKGKEGALENIAFTDTIGMHSSVVMQVKEGPRGYQEVRRILEMQKGREGEHGEFQINWTFSPMDMTEIPRRQLERERRDTETSLDHME